MNRLPALLCLIALGLGACKTTQTTEDEAPPPGSSFQARTVTDKSGEELSVWRDPRYAEQFSETYYSPSSVEPPLSSVELEQMQQVAAILQPPADPGAEAERQRRLKDATPEQKQQIAEEDEAADAARKAQALALLASFGESGQTNAMVDYYIGNIHFEANRLNEAGRAYQSAVDKFKRFRRAWRGLGLVYIKQSRWEDAVEPLRRVIELGATEPLTYGLLGLAQMNTGNYVSAESAYRQAILLDAETLNWKMGLAQALYLQGKYADVVALTAQLLAEKPDNADLWMIQANAYVQMDKPLKAAENYQLIDSMGRSTVRSLNTLGDIYVNQELFDLAVDAYTRALELDANTTPDRAIRAAKVMTARGALAQTRALVENVQRLRGEELSVAQRTDLLHMLSRIAVADGAGEREVAILKQIIELDPLDGEALILLGSHATGPALEAHQAAMAAEAAAKEAAAAAGKPDAGHEAKAVAERARSDADRAVAAKAERVAQAEFYYERAEAIPAFEADAKVRHAQLLVKLGEYDKAIPLLESAQKLKPRDNVGDYLEQVRKASKLR